MLIFPPFFFFLLILSHEKLFVFPLWGLCTWLCPQYFLICQAFLCYYRINIQKIRQLHSLPIEFRVLICPYERRRSLRLAREYWLVIPGPSDVCLTSTMERAFSVFAPSWWNQLSTEVRALWDLI